MNFRKIVAFLCTVIILSLLISGCGEKIQFSESSIPVNAKKISLAIKSDDFRLLDSLSKLKSADFTGSDCYEEIFLWHQEHPEIEVKYSLPLTEAVFLSSEDSELELTDELLAGADSEQLASDIEFFPNLKKISFSSDNERSNLELISAVSRLRPDISFDYEIKICGRPLDYSAKELHLEKMSENDAETLSYVITAMPELSKIYLGSDEENPDLSFSCIAPLVAARPDVYFDYSFSAFGKDITLMDKELDLKLIKMYDEGAEVREIISCMPALEYLDMDCCGVSNEAMASIRDDFPNVKVVWRIWFGKNYTARTDAEKILASRPSVGGSLTAENTQALKYCTDLKAIDLGHNELLEDISFISYMPKLEVVLIPMEAWTDASVLANCPNIEYLEIQTTNCTDLSPLKNLKKLRHLNIGHLFELTDISPIYDLDLERLWIGCMTPIPEEQVKEFQRRHPKCEINTTTYDPTDGGWRYPDWEKYGPTVLSPRYEELRKTFEYDKGDLGFNFIWSDPISWADYQRSH